MRRFIQKNAAFFVQNRNALMSKMQPNAIAIFHSGDQFLKSADATHTFYQNPDLFYLSGIDQEDTILVLFPDAPVPEWREVLFLKQTSEQIKIWEGYKYTQEEANALSGIKTIKWNSTFNSLIKMMMHQAQHVYINLNEHDRSHFEGDYKDFRLFTELKSKFPLHQYHRSAPIVSQLRTAKKDYEIDLMQKAANITKDSFVHLLKNMRHFKHEFEIEAEITYFFNKNRAEHAYNPIIAGGDNANVLHYNDNDKPLKAGDLILMDYGARFGNYASDMTRTIPYSGTFLERQKTIYNACLNVFKKSKALMSCSISLLDYNNECKKIMESELIQIGLLDKNEVLKQDPNNPLYRKYFPHGVAHFLGLDVHDVGNHYEILPENAVLTCEPGIYIQDEGIGIRIENDILLKSNGVHIDFLNNCPIEVEEIETLMHS